MILPNDCNHTPIVGVAPTKEQALTIKGLPKEQAG